MIYTSYYAKYRGENGVAVSNSYPKGLDIQKYKPLVPDWNLVQNFKSGAITRKEFRREYIKQLKQLSALNVYKELDGKVLLCYEKDLRMCHRKCILEWFTREGFECAELETNSETCTCNQCKYCFQYSRGGNIGWICRKTGEIIPWTDGLIRACEDWRYFG
jgi:uncharacterized protein YeaO (DUF488 family)